MLTKTPSKTKVPAGNSVSYLYNATNTGSTPLTGSIIDDVYGAVGYFTDLAPGGWVGFNVTHTITETTTNTATATGTDPYGTQVTDTAIAIVQVYRPVAGIRVTKVGKPGMQCPPGTITWNVTVTNIGTMPLYAVNVTDTLHGYLGSIGVLNAGETIFFVVVESALPAGVYTDEATAYGWYQAGDVVFTDSDSAKCVVGPGFVVPEVPFGVIMVLSAMILALAAFSAISKQMRRKKN